MDVRGKNRARTERGAAVIEFALVATLLLTLVTGIISYGYMLSFRQGISQGAAEGARAAAVAATDASRAPNAIEAVNEALDSYGVVCGTDEWLRRAGTKVGSCTVEVKECENDGTHDCASVTLDYFYKSHPLVPSFPGLNVFLPQHLEYTAVARVS